jgi:hypothetical protein
MRAIALIFVAMMLFCVLGCEKAADPDRLVLAYGTVYGSVTDNDSGNHLENIQVTVIPPGDCRHNIDDFLRYEVETNENGEYSQSFSNKIPASCPKRITLRAEHEGYQTYVETITFENGSEFMIDISLIKSE